MPGRDSNPQFQQAMGRGPTRYNARPVSSFADPNVYKTAQTQLVRTHSLHVERKTDRGQNPLPRLHSLPSADRTQAVGDSDSDR
jgi:hypothetical protein